MVAQQKALRLQSLTGEWKIDDVPVPAPGPGEILVKVHSTALNPVDWKLAKIPQMSGMIPQYPATLGSDAAGTVEELGEDVVGFAKGDRIVHQGFFTKNNATFQQFSVVPAEIAAKLPPNISFDQAASLPAGLTTAAIGFYNGTGYLPFLQDAGVNKYAGKPFVVFGGSSSVGQYAIQIAKLSGFNPIIATASPHNAQLLYDLGATHFIDRKANVVAEVGKITSRPVELIYDAVALESTQTAAWDLLAANGLLILVLPPVVDKAKYSDKKVINIMGNVHPPHNREFGKKLYAKLSTLLAEGAIKPNQVEILLDGLQGIVDGLERMSRDEISGVKLVAHPQETV